MGKAGKGKVTIKDVASYCGLSKSAVAYILSKSPNYKGTERSRRLVEEAAKALNYRPNFAGKSLSSKRGYAIGILMPIATSPVYGEMALEFQHLLWERGYCGIFSFWGSYDKPRKDAIDLLLERNIDGAICWPGAESIIPKDLPAVRFYESSEFDSVSFDYQAVAEDAIEHLLSLGHRRIAFIGVEGARLSAFKEARERKGLPSNEEWLHIGLDASAGREGALKMLKSPNPPTALVALNDGVAIAAMNAAQDLGVSIPGEFSAIGFDNMLEASLSRPPLTSFDIRIPEVVDALVGSLIERIEKPDAPRKAIKIKPVLIARSSTGPCSKR